MNLNSNASLCAHHESDLAPKQGSNAGEPEGSHRAVPGRNATGIKGVATGKKPEEPELHTR
jgi:hypothetical protein